MKVTHSCPTLCNPMVPLQPARLLCPWNSPGKNTEVGNHSLLQGILTTQGSNPGLLHCRQILYHLSHQGSSCYCLDHPLSSDIEASVVLGVFSADHSAESLTWPKLEPPLEGRCRNAVFSPVEKTRGTGSQARTWDLQDLNPDLT